MSSGAKVVTAYVKQTNKDTVPSTGWKVLPNISNGLTVTTELTESEMLDGGRVKKAGMVTSAEVSGDVESELMYGAFDDLIAAAFWSEWNTRAKPHTLQIGSTKTQFALTKDFTDINVNHIFKGCVVSKFTLSVDTSSLVKISFGLTGLGYEESTTRSFATNPTATPDTKKASGLSIGEIKVDGRNIGVCVESITFELDNQTEVQRCLGDNMYGGNILAMLANASGSMKIAYSPEAHNIIKEQLTGRIFSLEFPIVFSPTDKYVLKIPQMQVSGEIPSPSGTDLATVDVNYNVVNVSPVLEKHLA